MTVCIIIRTVVIRWHYTRIYIRLEAINTASVQGRKQYRKQKIMRKQNKIELEGWLNITYQPSYHLLKEKWRTNIEK